MPAKRRLLFILHQYAHPGGAEGQTRLLAERMREAFDVGVCWIDISGKAVVLRRLDDGSDARFPAEPVVQMPGFEEPITETSLRRMLAEFGPEIIHIANFSLWPLSMIDLCVEFGSAVVITSHDYFPVTPDYAMFGVSDVRETVTAQYSRMRFGKDVSGFLVERRERIAASFGRVRHRVVVSQYQKSVYEKVFPLSFAIIEPGIEPFDPIHRHSSAGGATRFGYLGAFIRVKGLITLTEAFISLRQRHPAVELRVFGGPVPKGPPPAGINMAGPFAPLDLPRVMGEFDVGVIPSLTPESYSLALSEMWQAKKPVIVSDIGALGERVSNGVDGLRVAPRDPAALAGAMEWFVENDSWRNWKMPAVRTADEMARDHRKLYDSL